MKHVAVHKPGFAAGTPVCDGGKLMPPLPVAQWHFWASWFCLVTGIMVTILGAIGGLRCVL